MLQAIKGKNGFLFLQNDTNDVIGQITGKRPLSEAELASWGEVLERRKRHAQKFNYRYALVIVPNKHCVYAEYLPDEIEISENRAAIQLTGRFPVSVHYPLEPLRANRELKLYYSLDTHWNDPGAAIALNNLLEPMGCSPIAFNPKMITETEGDLSVKFPGEQFSEQTGAIEYERKSRVVFDNHIHNVGHVIFTEQDNRDLPVGVVFGDSFLTGKIHILGEYFSKLYYFHAPVFDAGIIEKFKPDIVINCNIERFMGAPRNSLFSEEFDNKIYGYGFPVFCQIKKFVPSPHELPGVDQKRAAAFINSLATCATVEGWELTRLDFLSKNNLLRYLPHKTMRATGPIWPGNPANPFVGWAAGYVHHSEKQPRGVAFTFDNLKRDRLYRLSIFEIHENRHILDLTGRDPIWARTFAGSELFIYNSLQEVFFETPGLYLRKGGVYLVCVECDDWLGAGGSWNDLPGSDFLFRGYYRKKDDSLWRVIAKTESIAWRMII